MMVEAKRKPGLQPGQFPPPVNHGSHISLRMPGLLSRGAAVCFRGRGLPLLSLEPTPQELNPSPNRPQEPCIGRLLRHLPTNIRSLPTLASAKPAWSGSCNRPNHTGYPAGYVIRLNGDVAVRNAAGPKPSIGPTAPRSSTRSSIGPGITGNPGIWPPP